MNKYVLHLKYDDGSVETIPLQQELAVDPKVMYRMFGQLSSEESMLVVGDHAVALNGLRHAWLSNNE